jgi:hypothetical protein
MNSSFSGLMPSGPFIRVQVVYARPGQVWCRQVQLPAASTLKQALNASGFFQAHPQYASITPRAGVYGRECSLDHTVNDGDRVEIYRPLVFDPMESRRRRAAHKKSVMNRPAARQRRKSAT